MRGDSPRAAPSGPKPSGPGTESGPTGAWPQGRTDLPRAGAGTGLWGAHPRGGNQRPATAQTGGWAPLKDDWSAHQAPARPGGPELKPPGYGLGAWASRFYGGLWPRVGAIGARGHRIFAPILTHAFHKAVLLARLSRSEVVGLSKLIHIAAVLPSILLYVLLYFYLSWVKIPVSIVFYG